MTSTVPDVTSEQKTEDELWTEYMVALARDQENWRLRHEAWHAYVLTGLRSPADGSAFNQVADLWRASRDAEEQAYRAWKRVAYPLHNISLDGEDISSS